LLIVGDVDQLPSVGPGQVLADLINSGASSSYFAHAIYFCLIGHWVHGLCALWRARGVGCELEIEGGNLICGST
jgi:NAD(P)H-hydrate repair Nnr-like enzyme with NAD(P)H-hydrate dehydratase domain